MEPQIIPVLLDLEVEHVASHDVAVEQIRIEAGRYFGDRPWRVSRMTVTTSVRAAMDKGAVAFTASATVVSDDNINSDTGEK